MSKFLSRTLTPPSIRNFLSGVKLLHLFSGADYAFTTDFILSLNLHSLRKQPSFFAPGPRNATYVVFANLRGIARNALHTPRWAPPVSSSLLHQLSFFLLLNGDPRSATLLCAFLFAFFVMARLANIVPPSLRQFDPRRHLTRGDVALTAHGQFTLVNDCFIVLYFVFLVVHYVRSPHIAVWLSWFPLAALARFFFTGSLGSRASH